MKLTFKAFPGKLFKEFLDSFREQGNKFPIGESLLFQTNNEKKSTVCNIEIIPFEQAWTDAKTRDAAKPKDNANSSSNSSSNDEDMPF